MKQIVKRMSLGVMLGLIIVQGVKASDTTLPLEEKKAAEEKKTALSTIDTSTLPKLQAAIPTLTITSSTWKSDAFHYVAGHQARPRQSFFNINIGQTVGYAFISNPWYSDSPVIKGLDWGFFYLKSGLLTFVILAFDAIGQLILDLEKTSAVTMKLLIYDSNKTLIKAITFNPVSDATTHPDSILTKDFTPNDIMLGGLNIEYFPKGKYPVGFPIEFYTVYE